MSIYDGCRVSKLLLKGEKRKRSHKKKKTSETQDETKKIKDEDSTAHGGWWKIESINDIQGSVAIEFGSHTYAKALDNGLFMLGAPHNEGEGPSPEEILTAFKINDTKIALKSGYGKYLRAGKDGAVTGRSDAVGPMEMWEPVFQDGKLALLGSNDLFISISRDDDTVVAVSKRVGPNELVQLRSLTTKEPTTSSDPPPEDQGDVKQVEINFVKKFQKFQDKKLRLNEGDNTEVKKAREEGTLHEVLLDRRSKMKSDRYCK